MFSSSAPNLTELRQRIARIGRSHDRPGSVLSTGVAAIDAYLSGGLALGALHEVAGARADVAHGAAAALFAAGMLARTSGPVLWVCARADLFAPGLAAAGLAADRVVHVQAGRAVLAAMEEGLRLGCPGGVVGEVEGRLGLTASRRLHLAAEAAGVAAFVLRRARSAADPELAAPSAASTRWRIASLPSAPPLLHAPEVPGLGPPRWRLELLRARGAEPAIWDVEAGDAPGDLNLVAGLGDRSSETEWGGWPDGRLRA